MHYSVASGDIELYRAVLKWTKRFLRDNHVIRELYPDRHPREIVDLLSGIPERVSVYTTSDIRARVVAGNAVLQDLFEVACAAIREPSFYAFFWQGTLALFQRVIQERIHNSKKLKNALSLPDDELYAILWDDTIEMLLRVEEQSNMQANKALNADIVQGPFAHSGDNTIVLETPQLSTCKFLDNLAKARDEYWQKLRPTVYPAVVTLPKPFPRGLQIQHLIVPFLFDIPNMKEHAPYLASRVYAVMFSDPADALLPLPQDNDSKAAIGTFVDSFRSALAFYIPGTCDKLEKEQRFEKVWRHAVGPLSKSRMDEDEAIRFWYFHNIDSEYEWPQITKYRATETPWPWIPEVENPAVAHAWNPLHEAFGRLDNVSRGLGALKYLDVSLAIHGKTPRSAGLRSSMYPCADPIVPADQEPLDFIWDSRRNIGEGGVLSGLLYLEVLHGANNGHLLEKPFPSEDDPRYPVLYLDPQFQTDLETYGAGNACPMIDVGRHLESFPPTLLHHAAENVMSRLRALGRDEHESRTSIEWNALSMLICLTKSDRPALAKKPVLNAILERPETSSWHQQLLDPKFFRRLPSKDANWCLEAFADAVFERMHKNDDKSELGRMEEDEPMKSSERQLSSSKPFIKITTIKLLAQLLQDTGVINDDHAFSLLSMLITKASHVDVRLQTTKVLLDKFASCPNHLCEKIIAPIESIIPLAGNLNERSPLTEDDWLLAEATLSPPEYPDIDHTVPLLHVLIDYYKKLSEDGYRLKLFTNRILLPTLSHLKRQTARWITIFPKRHGINDSKIQVPAIPSRSGRITTLLKEPGVRYLTRTLIQDLTAYSTFRLSPPAPIDAMNKRLLADKTLLAQKDVQAWFEMYSTRIDASLNPGLFDLFNTPTALDENIGIKPKFVREQFLQLFRVVVKADAPTYTHLTDILLRDVLNGTYFMKPWWSTHGVAIVREMIAHVDSLRTLQWERDSQRVPAVLPDTFAFRWRARWVRMRKAVRGLRDR